MSFRTRYKHTPGEAGWALHVRSGSAMPIINRGRLFMASHGPEGQPASLPCIPHAVSEFNPCLNSPMVRVSVPRVTDCVRQDAELKSHGWVHGVSVTLGTATLAIDITAERSSAG